MKKIYEVFSFDSNEWVESGKYEYDKTESRLRRTVQIEATPFRQPNRLDLMSEAEIYIQESIERVDVIGADEMLTNAVIKLGQARDLVYEYYRLNSDKNAQVSDTTDDDSKENDDKIKTKNNG